jgi:hypothetical protein
MREVEERSARKTKAARRAMERRNQHRQITPPKTADEQYISTNNSVEEIYEDSNDETEIPSYDEIEIYD